MEYLQDALRVLVRSAKETLRSLPFVPLLIGLQILVSVLYWLLAGTLLRQGGFIGGIIFAVFRAALWSVYLYGLYHAVHRSRFTTEDLKTGFGVFFRDLYIAAFVLWIVQMLISVLRIPYTEYLVLLVFSALPETLYLARTRGFDKIRESFEFLQENWYIWLPLTLLMAVLLERISFGVTLTLLRPFGGFGFDIIAAYLVHMVLFSVFALFRGHLYRILYGSSLRKRKFMGHFQ